MEVDLDKYENRKVYTGQQIAELVAADFIKQNKSILEGKKLSWNLHMQSSDAGVVGRFYYTVS